MKKSRLLPLNLLGRSNYLRDRILALAVVNKKCTEKRE